jgi:hypothetical protein
MADFSRNKKNRHLRQKNIRKITTVQNIGGEHEHKKLFSIRYDMSTIKHAIVKLLIEHGLNVAFNKCYM